MNKSISRLAINKNMALVSMVVKPEAGAPQAPPQPTNRIAIFDRSGSMGWTLPKVVDDLYEWAKKVPHGDTITLGYFSSQGEFRFILKGLRMTGDADLAMVRKILDANRHTIGMTCFSEILSDLKSVVNDLTPISNKFTMIFFTDGCPVVRDVRREISAIEQALKAVRGSLASSLFVGYGDYYNRNLMADMAMWSGGALVHADNLEKFASEIQTFTEATSSGAGMVEVALEPVANKLAVFTLSGKNPVLLPVDSDTVRVPADAESTVYILTGDTSNANGSKPTEIDLRGLYAAAVILSRMNRSDEALEVIGHLGDPFFANRIANSFTTAEIGTTEELLSEAIVDDSKRFIEGKKKNCVPRRDAFCVLDALSLLIQDDDAKFYPGSPLFQYKRVGLKAVNAEGYSEFVADKSAACPMNNLVMHESRMNLSIATQIPGTITLTAEAAQYGLPSTFSTFVFRNYTIVKDGALNVGVLPVSMSETTFKALQKEGVIGAAEQWQDGKVYAVSLGGLPVMNRAMADGNTSAKALVELLAETYPLEGEIKALKHYLKMVDVEGKATQVESMLGKEALDYLATQGVGRFGYQPKRKLQEATDQYIAKEFKVTAKGFSSYPKIDDVVARRAAGKPQTKSGEMVLRGVEAYEKLAAKLQGDALIEALKQEIADRNRKLRALRAQIQKTKFAILLGNRWFDEFDSRDDCKIALPSQALEFSFAVVEVPVEV